MTNGLYLAFADMLHNDQADADAAERAFNGTDGTFFQRITAAIDALLLPHLRAEKFIQIPDNPEQMNRGDLDALVRPVAEGFLRSHPSKDDLLYQLELIARRQASRPTWMPRTEDSPRVGGAEHASDEGMQPVPLRLSGFPELGEVTINAPAYYGDSMYPADGNDPALLQMALLTIFGATTPSAADRTLHGDETTLDALVPAENRWWVPPEVTLTQGTAADDPMTAIEVSATIGSLGGTPVQDVDEPDGAVLAADVLLSAGPWWHSPEIVVDECQPADGSRDRSLTRVSFAGWATDTAQGFVMVIISKGWDEEANVYPLGYRLHSSIMWWTAPTATGPQTTGALRRVVMHCPGAEVCQRGGCEEALTDELVAAVGLIAANAAMTASVAMNADWAANAHRQSLLGSPDDEPGEVLSFVTEPLRSAGWEEIFDSWSELGDVEVLLSRRDEVLLAAYSPLTRRVVLEDGRRELGIVCQILADEGVLVEDAEGDSRLNRRAAADNWEDATLSVIEKHLRGGLSPDNPLSAPIEVLLTGVWPWGTGVPSNDGWRLVERQVMQRLAATTLLGS